MSALVKRLPLCKQIFAKNTYEVHGFPSPYALFFHAFEGQLKRKKPKYEMSEQWGIRE